MTTDSEGIRRIFDAIAPVYDDLNDQMSFGLHRVWKKMAVDWTQTNPGDRVLDLCCGTGDLAFLLSRRVGITGKVYGLDFSANQIAQARKRDKQRAIRWMVGDALALPFPENYFDGVIQSFGLRNVVDISACLREIRRVLKPASQAVILDLHRPDNLEWSRFQQWYLEQRVASLGRERGLEAEYAYIAPSLERFPTGVEQVQLAKQAGFQNARHLPLIGGAVGALILSF
jgi:demethylphylloquinol methyltransferase